MPALAPWPRLTRKPATSSSSTCAAYPRLPTTSCICSATSEPQLKAISSSMREQVRERFGRTPISEDGYPASQWIILDYGDVIVHLFQGEKREFYSLEKSLERCETRHAEA